MNFNRSEDRDEDLEINFIPLIDVLLVIIIFLVVSTTFSKIHLVQSYAIHMRQLKPRLNRI